MFEVPIFDLLLIAFLKANDAAGSEPYSNELLWNYDHYSYLPRQEYYIDEHEPYLNVLLLQNSDNYPSSQRHEYYPDEHEPYTNELLQNLDHYPYFQRHEYYQDEHELYTNELLQNLDHYPSSPRREYYPDEPYSTVLLQNSDHYPSSQRHEYYPDEHEPYTNGHLKKSDRSYYTPLNKYVLIESRTPKKYLQTEGITKSVESTEIQNLLFDDDLPLYSKKVVKTELWPTFFSTKYTESLPFKGYDEGNGQFESKISNIIPSIKTKNQEFLSKWLRDYTATGIQTKKKYSSIDMGDNESHDNHNILASLGEIISSEKGQLGMKHPPSNPIQSSESLYETLSNMEREHQMWAKSQPSSPIQTEKSFEKILSNLLGQLWTRHQLPVAIRSDESLEENLLHILDQSSNPIQNSESLEENLLSREGQLWIKYKPSTTFHSGENIGTILSSIKGDLLTNYGPTNPTQTGESMEKSLPNLLDQLGTKHQLSSLQKSNEILKEILLNLLSQLWTNIQSSNPILRSESAEENLSGRENQSWTKYKPSISFQSGENMKEISPNIEGWLWINNEPSLPNQMEKLLEETTSNLLDNFWAQNPLINPVQNRESLEEILLNVKGQLKTEHQPSNTIKHGGKLEENLSNVLGQLRTKNKLFNYVQNGESLEEVLSFMKDQTRSKHQPSNSIENGETFEKILSNIKIPLRMEDQPFGLGYSRDYGTSEIQAEKETLSNGAHNYDKSGESLEKVLSIKKDKLSNDLTFNQNGNQMLLVKDISSLIFKGMDAPFKHVIQYDTPLSLNEGKYIGGEQIALDANKIFNTMSKLDNDFLGTRNDNDEKKSLDQREYEILRQTQVSKSNFTEHNSSASSNKSFENQKFEQEISNKNAKLAFQEEQNSDIENHYNVQESKNTSHGSDEDEIKDQMVKDKVRNHTSQPDIGSDEVTYGVLNTVIKNHDASNANENQDDEQKTEDQNDKKEYEQDDPFIHDDSDNNFQEEQYFDSLTYGKSHVQIPNPPKDVNKADEHEKEKLNFNQSIKQNDSLTYDTTESNVQVEEDLGRLKSNIHDEKDFGPLESITLAGEIINPSKSNIQQEKNLGNLQSNTQAELVFGPSEGNIQDKQNFDSLAEVFPESDFGGLDPLKDFQEPNKQGKYEINYSQSMKQNNPLAYVTLESNIQNHQDLGSLHDNTESNIEMSYTPKDIEETHKNKKDELSDNQSTEEINNSNPKGSLVKLVNLKDYLKNMYSKANNTNENITFFQEEGQNMQRHSESLSNHILGSVYKFYDYFKSLYTNPNSSNEQKPSPALRMTEEAVTDSYRSVTDDLGNSEEGSSNNAYALLSDKESVTNRRKRSSGNIFKTHDQGDKKKTKKQNHKIIHKFYAKAMKKPKWHSGKSFRKSI